MPPDSGKSSKTDPPCTPEAERLIAYDPQTALMTVIEPKIEADATSASPMGDDYDPATGTVTFSATDISLPGNFDIPVELRRWVTSDDYNTGGPPGWAWNIPFIRGNFLDVKDGHSDAGWDWGYNTWRHGKNCSGGGDTVINNNGDLIAGNAYWQGKMLHIPGVTSETFLDKADGQQVTKSNFRIVSCIENDGTQQGIVVAGPNGLTYTFNQIKTYYNGKAALKDPIVRTRLLMVTKIQDRFGNFVDYTYTNGYLSQISASDGRLITISGNSATANGRTWTYTSTPTGLVVGLPGGLGQWTYEGTSALAFKPNGIGGYEQRLRIVWGQPPAIPGCGAANTQYTVKVTTPGGLLATYTFKDTVHYRSNVDPEIYADIYDAYTEITRTLHCTVSRSLTGKSLSGPGVAPHAWNYAYSTNMGTFTTESGVNGFLTGPFNLPAPVGGYPSPFTAGTAVDLRTTTISGPDQKLVFYIDRKFQSIGESRVIAQDVLDASGTQLLKRQESTYSLGDYVGMHWYMCPCDGTVPVNENQLTRRINQTKALEKLYAGGGADTFTTTYGNFDAYGFSLTSQGSNSFSANVQSIQKTYLHDTTNGLIGLPLTETVNGVLASEHHYNAQGLRDWTKAFGKLKSASTYNGDGTLATIKDALNQTTTFTNWKRGTPRNITFADLKSQSAEVDDNGWITWFNNEVNAKTCYGYDAMGQLSSITYPSEIQTSVCNTDKWLATSRSFVPVASTEYGIPAGHWRETTTTGNAKKITYYDGLWRPLLTREYDAANMAGTERFSKLVYNTGGQVAFASYPATTSTPTTGVWNLYDALGRLTSTSQDSEQGLLTSTTTYNAGFTTTITNPRAQSATTTYLTYGQPSTDLPLVISAPESTTTTITRDTLGKPTALVRSGGGASATRSYAYNGYQELCRTVEPETGATLFGYDAAGNLTWSAAGVASGQACSTLGTEAAIASRKVSRTYNLRNRLTNLSFPDGNGNQILTYYDDGLPQQVTTANSGNTVTNAYTYNKRRLLTGESMVPDTVQLGWAMGYGYNNLGQVTTETYPASVSVSYTVNALGQTTLVKASADGGALATVASNASYYPNGGLKQFTYGNGIVHNMTQNARQLPSRSTDGSVLDLATAFDKNGNVASVTDYIGAGIENQGKSMVYDNLDRLTSATSPMYGTASYTYDALDNLKTLNVSGAPTTYGVNRVHTYVYDANNRLTNVMSAGSSVIGLGYDVQGNLNNKNGTGYTFDFGNRLRSTAGLTYRYDAQGRRVRLNAAGDTARKYSFYALDGRLTWQRDEPGSKRISNIYFNGSLLAELSRPIGSTTVTMSYYHTDALGSPIAKSNALGQVFEKSSYEPYGDLLNRPNDDRAGYTGHVMDSASGLTYMQQRYYDPAIGRFLSVDPVSADSAGGTNFNRYWYGDNNPYKFTDPDGRFVQAIYGAIAGGTGGYISSGSSFREKAVGVVTGAIAGGVVGFLAPQTSHLVGMAAAGAVASFTGQVSGSVSNAAIDKGITNVSMSDVKVDATTTVLGGLGSGVGGQVGRGVSMLTMRPVIGQTLKNSGAPTVAGMVVGSAVEGAIVGGAEKAAPAIRQAAPAIRKAAGEAVEKVKETVKKASR